MTIMGSGPLCVCQMRCEEGHRYRVEPAVLAINVAFGFTGRLLSEVVEPMGGDRSVFTEVLEERGPGYHHVNLRRDFDKGFAQLSEQGYKVALESTTQIGRAHV